MLSMVEDSGNGIKLVDTRPCAIERQISLDGLAYQVYVECDRALTYRELLDALGRKYGYEVSWDEIQLLKRSLQML